MNPPIASAEGLAGLFFLLMVAAVVVGAVIATTCERLTRAVSGLALCFIGVAGLYYYLESPFVALMQMLIYVGAVCVVIVFAVMLAEPHPEKQVGKANALTGGLSIGAAFVTVWGLVALGSKAEWRAAGRVNDGSLVEVGRSLLTSYSMVFELISVVLLVAIIGSVVLARAGRDK